jgi:hypothetical protein
VLFPWGYTFLHPQHYDALLALANKGNEAMFAVHGKSYEVVRWPLPPAQVGCIPCVLYTASGTSLDWALGVANIPYVYRSGEGADGNAFPASS